MFIKKQVIDTVQVFPPKCPLTNAFVRTNYKLSETK